MPNTASAKKRLRQNVGRSSRNRWRKNTIRKARKEFAECIEKQDWTAAQHALNECFAALDKAAKAKTIQQNRANRTKARLSRILRTASAAS